MLAKFSNYMVWCFGVASPWSIDELDSTLWNSSILEQTPDTVQATSWRWPCSPLGWLFPSVSVNIFSWLWSSSGISTDIRKMRGSQAWDSRSYEDYPRNFFWGDLDQAPFLCDLDLNHAHMLFVDLHHAHILFVGLHHAHILFVDLHHAHMLVQCVYAPVNFPTVTR